MSRQIEQADELRNERRHKAIVVAVEFGLSQAVKRSGAIMTGFAYKDRGSDCLLVLKGDLAGRPQVAFVGSDDLGGCLIKAVKLGQSDKLVWREDRYGGQS